MSFLFLKILCVISNDLWTEREYTFHFEYVNGFGTDYSFYEYQGKNGARKKRNKW